MLLTVDDVNVSKGMVKWVSNLTKESVVDIQGVIMAPESGKVESCTQQDVELVAQSIYCVSRSVPRLPFEVRVYFYLRVYFRTCVGDWTDGMFYSLFTDR